MDVDQFLNIKEQQLRMYPRHLLITLALVLTTHQTKVKILDTPDGFPHPEPCAMVCSGIARHSDGQWYNSSFYEGKAGREIVMKDCDFVSSPLVTVSAQGHDCPSLFVSRDIDTDRFAVYTVETLAAAEVIEKRCDVFWMAAGYDCN